MMRNMVGESKTGGIWRAALPVLDVGDVAPDEREGDDDTGDDGASAVKALIALCVYGRRP